MDRGASPLATGPSQVEPVPVSPLRASVPSAWQPAETAPKDGTVIDVWTRLSERWTDVHWNASKADWLRWGLDSYGGHGWQRVDSPVTHWMPLPASPHSRGEAGS